MLGKTDGCCRKWKDGGKNWMLGKTEGWWRNQNLGCCGKQKGTKKRKNQKRATSCFALQKQNCFTRSLQHLIYIYLYVNINKIYYNQETLQYCLIIVNYNNCKLHLPVLSHLLLLQPLADHHYGMYHNMLFL